MKQDRGVNSFSKLPCEHSFWESELDSYLTSATTFISDSRYVKVLTVPEFWQSAIAQIRNFGSHSAILMGDELPVAAIVLIQH